LNSGASKPHTEGQNRSAEERFVRYLAKWSIAVTLLIVSLDLAVVRNYPFPDLLGDFVRGTFYTVFSIGLAITSIFLAFLGYRIISLRYVKRTRAIYLIFLPVVVLLTSIVWFVLLAGQQ
jgi:hypothetical protein